MSNVPETTQGGSDPAVSPILVLIVGVLAISTSAILIRLAQDDAPSIVIAAGRLTVATLVIAPWTLYRRQSELKGLPRASWSAAVFSGIMLGLHFAAYITALEYTSIAAATVLATSTPIWVTVASPFLLGERLTSQLRAGIAMAVVGSVVIALDDTTGSSRPLLGNLLALSSGITGAVYYMIGRRLRQRLSLFSYTSIVYGCAAITLIVMATIAGYKLWGYGATTVLLFALMAIFPQLLGHSSFNYALAFLPAAYVSVATISEPLGASLLGLLVFGELPGWLTVLGGALLLGGILMAGRRGTALAETT